MKGLLGFMIFLLVVYGTVFGITFGLGREPFTVSNILIYAASCVLTPFIMAAMIKHGENEAKKEIALQRRYGVGDQTIEEWRMKGRKL